MTRLEWLQANQITAAGYAAGERAADGAPVSGPIAVLIEGPDDTGVVIEGSKTELLRFATDIIEAAMIGDARAKDRTAREAALTFWTPERLEELQAAPVRVALTPAQAAAFEAGKAGWDLAGVSIDGHALEEYAAAGARLRLAALTGDGKVGRYTMAELEAMPMDDYIAACAELLGTEGEPE